MNASNAQVGALSTDTHTEVNDEQLRQSVDLIEVDSDTWSSYTDDESSPRGQTSPNGMGTGVWSREEHTKFLEAIKVYTNGPWKLVAAYVGTRTVRQTMTHAQKYRQKAARRLRGLRTKQALMRMHFGHYVSEETLVQERLRSMGAAKNNICHHLACEPIPVDHSSPRNSSLLATETLPSGNHNTIESASPEELACLDATMLDMKEIDLLEDLTTIPTLEECATELLQLLF
ncbi:hypothetical protein F441_00611 [Phytophthora nicotianae CJ01A1]|uniref:Uncharacterized protein n=4 Tax=Phytophthora nicotianae TaxID=4792 RepID=W2RHA8_PHYN3|nr:hypothetical protein PPTG_00513 [Phytophthora nicotianae INRA-310]ETK96785.1 hypothetical protein L915_00578 [Phytophthora nicotianae]ETP26788.1 hypothetical protein F441_00611 [Phytophthora nicotianae CJ01A1]ETP27880.1 hypothetical protein F442_22830 [Phytophthora nicotianae P10297]KUF81431.1 Myb protein J [Phytophthora nicotianae]ETN24054.1 hypothetical protein PPTG_00513 [Phytophthora nicotianae INRA-310]